MFKLPEKLITGPFFYVNLPMYNVATSFNSLLFWVSNERPFLSAVFAHKRMPSDSSRSRISVGVTTCAHLSLSRRYIQVELLLVFVHVIGRLRSVTFRCRPFHSCLDVWLLLVSLVS